MIDLRLGAVPHPAEEHFWPRKQTCTMLNEPSPISEHPPCPTLGGFATNPTLMRQAGIADYEYSARDILGTIPARPVSFGVFAAVAPEIERQARKTFARGSNEYMTIPIGGRSAKVALVRRDLHNCSLDTAEKFHQDAKSGFAL
jgi:hypothetical protein